MAVSGVSGSATVSSGGEEVPDDVGYSIGIAVFRRSLPHLGQVPGLVSALSLQPQRVHS